MSQSSDILLSRFVSVLSIAHHIPGRIRLKLAGSLDVHMATLANDANSFARAAQQTPGIHSVSVNPLAKSCTVEYDAVLIPPVAWADLLSGQSGPDADRLRRALLAAVKA